MTAMVNDADEHVETNGDESNQEQPPNDHRAFMLVFPPFRFEIQQGDADAIEGVVQNGTHDANFPNAKQGVFE